MATRRLNLPRNLPALGLVLLLVSACAVPRIVILDDPLTAREHNDLGVVYEQKGAYDVAEKEYRRAIDKDKHWAVPWFNLGNLAYRRGELSQAERHYRTALRQDGNNADVMNNLANVLADQGKRAEAAALIERALAIDPKPAYRDTARRIRRE